MKKSMKKIKELKLKSQERQQLKKHHQQQQQQFTDYTITVNESDYIEVLSPSTIDLV